MTRHPTRRRAAAGMSAVEVAVGVSVVGSLLAVAVPTVLREIHASLFAEAAVGLAAIGAGAIAYSLGRPVFDAFPHSVGPTPATPPRGHLEVDPAGTWMDPAWHDLAFPVAGSGLDFVAGVP